MADAALSCDLGHSSHHTQAAKSNGAGVWASLKAVVGGETDVTLASVDE